MLKHMLAASATTALIVGAASPARAGKKPSPTPRPTKTVEAVRVPLKAPARSMAELEAGLASPDAAARAAAASELAGAGTVPESVGNRLKALLLEDPDPAVRAAAVWAFAHVKQGVAQADGTLSPVPYDEPPRLVEQAKVVYPDAAFDAGIQGTVQVAIVIDEEGRVARAEVRESIPELDEAALAAVRAWQFAPAKLKGRPIATVVTAPVAFAIRSAP
jgi:protein TonB